MKFQPKSEQEVAAAGNWLPGLYDFEVLEAEEKESRNGNNMIALKVRLYNDEGRSRTVFDNLIGTEAWQYKVRHFAEAVGLVEDYEKGELHDYTLTGRTGRCKVGIQKGTDGYADKNVVQDYVKNASPARSAAPVQPRRQPVAAGAGGPSWSAQRPAGGGDDLNDDIPFGPCWQ